jgi:hypothetical protein
MRNAPQRPHHDQHETHGRALDPNFGAERGARPDIGRYARSDVVREDHLASYEGDAGHFTWRDGSDEYTLLVTSWWNMAAGSIRPLLS